MMYVGATVPTFIPFIVHSFGSEVHRCLPRGFSETDECVQAICGHRVRSRGRERAGCQETAK